SSAGNGAIRSSPTGPEKHVGRTLTFYRLPRQHHTHLKSTTLLERVNEEIERRTRVVRIFPNEQSCPPLVRALCAEIHQTWLEDNRYIAMDPPARAARGGNEACRPSSPASGPCLSICTTRRTQPPTAESARYSGLLAHAAAVAAKKSRYSGLSGCADSIAGRMSRFRGLSIPTCRPLATTCRARRQQPPARLTRASSPLPSSC